MADAACAPGARREDFARVDEKTREVACVRTMSRVRLRVTISSGPLGATHAPHDGPRGQIAWPCDGVLRNPGQDLPTTQPGRTARVGFAVPQPAAPDLDACGDRLPRTRACDAASASGARRIRAPRNCSSRDDRNSARQPLDPRISQQLCVSDETRTPVVRATFYKRFQPPLRTSVPAAQTPPAASPLTLSSGHIRKIPRVIAPPLHCVHSPPMDAEDVHPRSRIRGLPCRQDVRAAAGSPPHSVNFASMVTAPSPRGSHVPRRVSSPTVSRITRSACRRQRRQAHRNDASWDRRSPSGPSGPASSKLSRAPNHAPDIAAEADGSPRLLQARAPAVRRPAASRPRPERRDARGNGHGVE